MSRSIRRPEVGKYYQHFKNKHIYKVISMATQEADGKEVVVYREVPNGRTYTRNADLWFSRMPSIEDPNTEVSRFTEVPPPEGS